MSSNLGGVTHLPNQGGEPRQLHLHFSINSGEKNEVEREIYIDTYIHQKGPKKSYWLVFLSKKKKKAELYPVESFHLMEKLPLI